MTTAWKCKTDALKASNEVLSDSFNQAITSEIDEVMQDIKTDMANTLEEMTHQTNKAMRIFKESSTGFADEAIQERETALQGFEEKYNTFLSAFEKRAAEINQAYQNEMKELEKVTHAIVEKQQRHNHIFENGKFLFSNLIMVVIAVILIRALFFGVWEGLYVNELYAWGSQWEWLKYGMWGLFVVFIGALIWAMVNFMKSNLTRYRYK